MRALPQSGEPAGQRVDRMLDLVADAEIAIVTLPTVNMYLQDRKENRTPRWRGVTVVHEMHKRGIPVAAAGDNCRDSFYAYGDHDVLDPYRQAVRILHLYHPLTVHRRWSALCRRRSASFQTMAALHRCAGQAHRIQRTHHQRDRQSAAIGQGHL